MTVYFGSNKIKGIYLGTQNTNCLTYKPKSIDLSFKTFTQPVLTENGTMGGDSFACDQSAYYTETGGDEQKAWYVFDGNKSIHEWQVNGVKLDTWYWLSWYNPIPIKISKVGVMNANGGYSILAWKLQGCDDNSSWVDLATGTNENVTGITTWYMEIPEEKQSFYKYYRTYCQPRSTTALMIRELTLTAVEPTIVLKAGSKVYPAYGTLGNSNTTTSDITATNTFNGQYMVIRSGLTAMYLANINSCLSGAVANRPASLSTNTGLYFATDENKMYLTGNGGVDWYSGSDYSLPLAIVTVSNGAISSIDQVFNDFGFIGSTLFALPGVKGLNPNGFENGAYANKERILGNVAIYTNTSYASELAFGFNGTQVARWSSGYEEVDELPDVTTVKAFRRFYVRPENKIYVTNNNTAWIQETSVFAGYLTIDSTAPYNITSLTVNSVQPEKTLRKINFIYKGSTRVYADFEPVTFNVSSSLQAWTVPNGLTKIHVDCVASQGYGDNGGNGGRVECDLNVTPGDTIYFMVGGIPSNTYTASYNASDIRIGGTEYANRIVVAGGGGSKSSKNIAGGAGGGLTGGSGSDFSNYAKGGGGGTQAAGGSGGYATHGSKGHHHIGIDGNLGMGGSGSTDTTYEGDAGAGGAGYYGGGSGGACWSSSSKGTAGGGGGSSYTDSSLCSNVTHTQGYRSGAGYITISLV